MLTARYSPSSIDYYRHMLSRKHAYDLKHPFNKTVGMRKMNLKLNKQKEEFLQQHEEAMMALGDPSLPSNRWRRGDIKNTIRI